MRRVKHLLAIVILLGSGACTAKTAAPKPTSRPPTTTAARRARSSAFPVNETQTQILRDIRTKGITKQRALMLFSIQIGSLPGVPKHTGPVDKDDFDGTEAAQNLYAVWGQLSMAQRKEASRLLRHSTSGASPSSAPPTTIVGHGATPAPQQIEWARPRSSTDQTPAYDYRQFAADASAAEAMALGTKPITDFVVEVSYDPPGIAYASTSLYIKPPEADKFQTNRDGCEITVWDQKMAPISAPDAAAVMAHEFFHCYQQAALKTGEAVLGTSSWVEEGEATWVMAQLVPAGSNVVAPKWSTYALSPEESYKERGRDAIGVFGHYGDVVQDQSAVWPRLIPTLLADKGGADATALGVLIAGSETPFYQQWAASYFQDSSAPAWRMSGPGTPPTQGPTPKHFDIGSEQDQALPSATPAGSTLTVVDSTADVLIVYLFEGYGMVHDKDHGVDTTTTASAPVALCLRNGGCACPDGSPGAAEHTVKAKGPISVGINGGTVNGQGAVAGKSIDEFCKKPDKPPKRPPGGGGGGGGGASSNPDDPPPEPRRSGESNGDPHMTTFDGFHYDFQTVGEFTLARSTTDDFLVQTRQIAVPGSTFSSVNSAVAIRQGGHRLEIAIEAKRPVLRLDGKPQDALPKGVAGLTISRSTTILGDQYDLTLADGTEVRVTPLGLWGLAVNVSPAPARKGKLVGLLGDFDGNKANDLSDKDINHAFADHWRISQADSLFTYPAGRSTTDYTDRKFPYTTAIPNRAAAEKVCRDAGITDAVLLKNCVVDLAATNAPLFTSLYGYGQAVSDAKSGNVSAGATAPVNRTVTLRGTVGGKKTTVKVPFHAKAGDVIWVWTPGCTDSQGYVGMRILGPDGQAIRYGEPACQYGRAAFPKTATYQIELSNAGGPPSPYVVPIRYKRHDVVRKVAYGQTISGTIPQVAAHDIYRFKGSKGDTVHFWGPGCSLDVVQVVIYDPRGNDNVGYGCRKDTPFTLTATGTWSLVVNDANQGPGSYKFVLQH